jgi:hypothetical protein
MRRIFRTIALQALALVRLALGNDKMYLIGPGTPVPGPAPLHDLTSVPERVGEG